MTSSIPFDLYLRLSGRAAQPGLSGSNEPDPPHDGADGDARRLAWQRALEHAQDGGFAGWFGPAQAPVEITRSPDSLMAKGASFQGLPATTHASTPTSGAGAQAASLSVMRQVSPRASDDQRMAAVRDIQPREDGAANAVARDAAAPLRALLASELAQAWAVSVLPVSSAADVLDVPAMADEARQLPVQMPGAPVTWLAMESPVPGGATTSGEEVPAQDGASGERVAKLPPRSGANDTVRLHVEWSQEGVRIWLGSDAGSQIPVAGLALQLQRLLAAYGERLLGLVCNGQSVWEEGGKGDPMPTPTGLPGDASPQDARGAFPLPARFRGISQPYSKELP